MGILGCLKRISDDDLGEIKNEVKNVERQHALFLCGAWRCVKAYICVLILYYFYAFAHFTRST